MFKGRRIIYVMNNQWKMINQSKVYQVVNINMSSLCLLFSAIILFCLLATGQIIVPSASTLIDTLQAESNNDTTLAKTYVSILQAHPQLAHFYIYNVTSTTVNTNGTDYYITLRGGDNYTVMVVVSLEPNTSSFFVSYIKMDPNGQQITRTNPIPSYQAPQVPGTNGKYSPQAILDDSSRKIQGNMNKKLTSGPLGGFRPLSISKDVKFSIATNHFEQTHPNIVNYQLVLAEYQVNAGVNYRVLYAGLDQMTKISAILYVGLDALPQIMEFEVSCLQTSGVECSNQIASSIFIGNEHVIKLHPELKTYRLVSIYIQQRTGTGLNFMATFQNKLLSLRAISEVGVTLKTAKVLSYYSYRYQ